MRKMADFLPENGSLVERHFFSKTIDVDGQLVNM